MQKKKIALAINYDYHDYGGMLQSYATQVALTKMGIDSFAINYDNLKSDINHRKIRYFISNIFDWSIVKEKGKIVQKKLLDKFNKKLSSEQAIRDAAFDRFQQKFITTEPYPSWGALTEACRDYDAVLVGSDQLWLPSNIVADYYTLSFVPKEVRKIAYATSFGIGAIPHGMENLYAHFLSRIDYLSARETSGQEIIKQSTGRDVPLVCDPTMLLEKSDWKKIATQRRIVNDKYIFCYFMGNNPEQRDFVKKMAKSRGYKIVGLIHLDQYIKSDEQFVDYALWDITPADFVALVRDAEYVCTDSFHGTVFSILFHKNFLTFKRFNKKASLSTNTRIFSLLDRLNLKERLFTREEDINKDFTIINYGEIQDNLSQFRSTSIEFITQAMNNSNCSPPPRPSENLL